MCSLLRGHFRIETDPIGYCLRLRKQQLHTIISLSDTHLSLQLPDRTQHNSRMLGKAAAQ